MLACYLPFVIETSNSFRAKTREPFVELDARQRGILLQPGGRGLWRGYWHDEFNHEGRVTQDKHHHQAQLSARWGLGSHTKIRRGMII